MYVKLKTVKNVLIRMLKSVKHANQDSTIILKQRSVSSHVQMELSSLISVEDAKIVMKAVKLAVMLILATPAQREKYLTQMDHARITAQKSGVELEISVLNVKLELNAKNAQALI